MQNSMFLSLCVLLTLEVIMVKAAFPDAVNYCATFISEYSQGVTGYFGMSIKPSTGQASYTMRVDVSNVDSTLAATCRFDAGLSYHIHSYWNNNPQKSGNLTTCGASYTGGHYDPNFACGGASQYASDIVTGTTSYCSAIKRTSSDGYTYPCNTTNFESSGRFSVCEVGDLSGKFGSVTPNNNIIQASPVHLMDPLAPYTVNLGSADTTSTQWNSVVFHCSNGTRLFCAKLEVDTGVTSQCFKGGAYVFDTETNDAETLKYTQQEMTDNILVSVFMTIFGTALISFLIWFSMEQAAKGERMKEGLAPPAPKDMRNNPMHTTQGIAPVPGQGGPGGGRAIAMPNRSPPPGARGAPRPLVSAVGAARGPPMTNSGGDNA
jgi:hypothetical protein